MQEEQERQRKHGKNLAMQGSRDQGYYRSNRYRMGMGGSGGNRMVFFYNPQNGFLRKGNFPANSGAEDNWKMIGDAPTRNTVSMGEEDEVAEEARQEEKTGARPAEKKNFYTQDLPLTDSFDAGFRIIGSGMRSTTPEKIFKAEFEDYPRSAESF